MSLWCVFSSTWPPDAPHSPLEPISALAKLRQSGDIKWLGITLNFAIETALHMRRPTAVHGLQQIDKMTMGWREVGDCFDEVAEGTVGIDSARYLVVQAA